MGKTRKKLNPFAVIGELLLLGGLGVFGFVLWQPWYTSNVVNDLQENLATTVTTKWQNEQPTAPKKAEDGSTILPVPQVRGQGDVFGVLYVPTFGRQWAYQIAGGQLMNPIMDDKNFGIAHYSETGLPGQKGNFAISAHRSGGYTAPFHDIEMLKVGDPLFVETVDGWYTYRFRSYEYVLPDAIDVLQPFPRGTTVDTDNSFLTLTTCNPKYYGVEERLIAYSVFEGFTPRAEGAPKELRKLNPKFTDSNQAANS